MAIHTMNNSMTFLGGFMDSTVGEHVHNELHMHSSRAA